jgi:hypothetical protein
MHNIQATLNVHFNYVVLQIHIANVINIVSCKVIFQKLYATWRAPKSRGETKLKVSQSQVAESRLGSTLPASNSRKGYRVELGAPGLD